MREDRPSLTALRVAMRRAAHQILDDPPRVLDDPLAVRIVGSEIESELRTDHGPIQARAARSMRAFMVARSRFAEDELADSVRAGATQCVILGAGLDTFACRNPHANLAVFEVDHPATQSWKRQRLAAAGISIPSSVRFAPIDFQRDTLADGLNRAGFRSDAVTFFSWLGVTPYLTRDAATATLRFIASMPAGSGVVFDYGIDRSLLSLVGRFALDRLSQRVAAAGEPFQLFFRPDDLAEELRDLGFTQLTDLGHAEINERYFRDRTDGLSVGTIALGRLMSARR